MPAIKILVIDDDPDVLSSIAQVLQTEAYDVSVAGDASAGLKIADRLQPDLIVLDLKLPGMSGIGFLNEITTENGKPRFPVLVLTAYANMESLFKNIDVDGFMLKPCTGDQLLAEVERILTAHGQQQRSTGDRPTARTAGRERLVLIIDGDRIRTQRLTRLLTQSGFRVESVDNVSDGVQQALALAPNVIAICGVMSHLNGWSLGGILRDIPRTSRIPLLVYDESGTEQHVMRPLAKDTRGLFKYLSSTDAEHLVGGIQDLMAHA